VYEDAAVIGQDNSNFSEGAEYNPEAAVVILIINRQYTYP